MRKNSNFYGITYHNSNRCNPNRLVLLWKNDSFNYGMVALIFVILAGYLMYQKKMERGRGLINGKDNPFWISTSF